MKVTKQMQIETLEKELRESELRADQQRELRMQADDKHERELSFNRKLISTFENEISYLRTLVASKFAQYYDQSNDGTKTEVKSFKLPNYGGF